MRLLIASILASSVLLASGADTAKVPRAKIVNAEKLINTQLASMYPEEPYFLLGLARGTYLDGVGAIFSVEVNLAMGPSLSPFKQTISKEEISRHEEKKKTRLPLLRTKLYGVVGAMANYLETLPLNEDLVFVVTLVRYPWEEQGSMPSQMILRVQKGKLMDAQRTGGKIESAIRIQEY